MRALGEHAHTRVGVGQARAAHLAPNVDREAAIGAYKLVDTRAPNGFARAMTHRPRLGALLALGLALGLAACTLPQAAGLQACNVRKAAEIPITLEQGHVAVAAVIQDRPVTMLVDTGAENLLVTPNAMNALGLSADRHRRSTIQGIGGAITTQNAVLQSFGVGGMEMLDQSAAVGALPAFAGPALHASGLIGADWLSPFDVELDLPHNRMALYRVEGCDPGYVAWQGPVTAMRAQLYGRGLLLLPVTLDGQRMTALLDSGAATTTLGGPAARQLGLSAAQLAGDRHGHSMGVDGTVQEVSLHRFGELQLGSARYAAPQIAVGRMRLPMMDLLLGVDWLRRNRVWINYAAHRVSVQPAA